MNITPDPIEIVLPAGVGFSFENFTFNVSIFQNFSNSAIVARINTSSGSPGNFITNFIINGQFLGNETNISIPVSGHNATTAVFRVPNDATETNYSGFVFVTSLIDIRVGTAQLNVSINNTNPVTSVVANITSAKTLNQDDNLTVQVNITKGLPNGTAPITVYYCFTLQSINAICDNSSFEEHDNTTIATVLNISRSIQADKAAGSYYLKIAVGYPGSSTFYNATDTFTITTPSTPSPTAGTGGGGGGVTVPIKPQPIEIQVPRLEIIAPSVVNVLNGHPEKIKVIVKNTGNGTAERISIVTSGLQKSWVTVFPAGPTNISAGEESEFQVEITVPENVTIDASVDFLVTAQDGVSATKLIILTVARSKRLQASLLLEEAEKLSKEIEDFLEVLARIDPAMDISIQEGLFENGVSDMINARNNFDLENYDEAIDSSKAAIERFDRSLNGLNEIARSNYDRIFDQLAGRFSEIEDSLEREIRNSIRSKFDRANVLFTAGRYKDAYETLLEIKELISPPLFGFFSVLFISVVIVLIVLAYLIYKTAIKKTRNIGKPRSFKSQQTSKHEPPKKHKKIRAPKTEPVSKNVPKKKETKLAEKTAGADANRITENKPDIQNLAAHSEQSHNLLKNENIRKHQEESSQRKQSYSEEPAKKEQPEAESEYLDIMNNEVRKDFPKKRPRKGDV